MQARVLVKSPKGPVVSPDDTFRFNEAFSNPQTLIIHLSTHIPSTPLLHTHPCNAGACAGEDPQGSCGVA
jgi:hypothetical protein